MEIMQQRRIHGAKEVMGRQRGQNNHGGGDKDAKWRKWYPGSISEYVGIRDSEGGDGRCRDS